MFAIAQTTASMGFASRRAGSPQAAHACKKSRCVSAQTRPPDATTLHAIHPFEATQLNLFTWILIGGLLGWGASMVVETRNWRVMLLNVAVGISGVMLGGWLLGELIGASAFNPVDFNLGGMLVSLLGATVLLAAVQLLVAIAGCRASLPLCRRPAEPEFSRSWQSYSTRPALHPLVMAALPAALLFVAGCASS